MSNQLSLSRKNEDSVIHKLKFLTGECQNKDRFIEKYIRSRNPNVEYESMLNDYSTLSNMEEFRNNLHQELIMIDGLEREKVALMQSIKRLEDLNKMNHHQLGDSE